MKYFILSLISFLSFGQTDIQKEIQRKFILAEDYATIKLPAGRFSFDGTLSLEGKKHILISGEGQDKTILSFSGQSQGAEGIRVSNCEFVTIADLTVEDTKGDAIKAMNVKSITFKNVTTLWTGTPKETNGAYGLYPVMCDGVLIDHCTAIGASDAGIYVGQSNDILVKNSTAKYNVAGIEIENSTNAVVENCIATNNTGGVLVFDLPDLVKKKGGNVTVRNNKIFENNYRNFAPKGNIVGTVPAGTGVLVLATNHVLIEKNEILKNNSVGIGVISYYMTERPINDKAYHPYAEHIEIRSNAISRDRVKFQGKGRLGQLYKYKLRFGKNVPHIVWDGILPKGAAASLCIMDNGEATFANIKANNNFKNMEKSLDNYTCTFENLALPKN